LDLSFKSRPFLDDKFSTDSGEDIPPTPNEQHRTFSFYTWVDGDAQIEAERELGRRLASGSLAHMALFVVVLAVFDKF
jgi:hypothetical protein